MLLYHYKVWECYAFVVVQEFVSFMCDNMGKKVCKNRLTNVVCIQSYPWRHSYVGLFVRLFVCSFVRSFVRSFVHSFHSSRMK